MYIKSIVLDGFKSYGNRVEITGFDPEFNAITGLNGTGKSNILDSICFVLGITNLSNVRAGSLQELIYKHGQAGITKATVSITFDNRDKRQCPIGYEDHDEITVTRQVVMGGKNKYLINGINVQNKRVSDLFCSVQLNVNNPHFLIMQGRITKVLNMKPPEILSMVEEAAGTRMYEAKKQAAQKTIEKKDAKLNELNDIIMEDITPKLQKLQEERSHYQEFQKVNRELESVTKLHIAWTYTNLENQAKEIQDEISNMKNNIEKKKLTITNNNKEVEEIEKKIDDLNKKLDEESGSDLQRLERELSDAQGAAAAQAAVLSAAEAGRRDAAHRLERARAALADDAAALEARRADAERRAAAAAQLTGAAEEARRRHDAARRRLLAASAGRESDDTSLQDRLIEAKRVVSEAVTRISANALEKKHAEERLRILQKEWAKAEQQFKKDTAGVQRLKAELEKLRAENGLIEEGGGAEALRAAALGRLRGAEEAAQSARGARDLLAPALARVLFRYTPPEPDFDPARVHGVIAELIEIKDPSYSTAIETVAGNKLYNVVVDTEHTGKLLLQRGQLERRVTIIPLNKIRPSVIDARTTSAARALVAPDHDAVIPALELVRYGDAVSRGVEWAVGGSLVCRDLDTARVVAFHPTVSRRCVTVDGDVVDPAGTLTGGAAVSGVPLLQVLREYRAADARLTQALADIDTARAAVRSAEASREAYHSVEVKLHELKLLETRLATTAPAQMRHEIDVLTKRVEELTASLTRDRETEAAASAEIEELEAKLRDIQGHREREFKRAEREAEEANAEATKLQEEAAMREQEAAALELERAELQRALDAGSANAQAAEADLLTHEAARAQAADSHRQLEEAMKELQARVQRQKQEMALRSSEINKLVHKKEKLAQVASEIQLRIEEEEFKVKEREAEADKVLDKARRLEASAEWLSAERAQFGVAGGPYEWEARGAAGAGGRAAALAARRDRLARSLNTRAHHLLDKEERQYQDLMRKKRIVEADRAKLVQVMEELDEKKRVALAAAVDKVGAAFGAMFSRLLPGASARLAPADHGLRVEVGLGGTWKEDLAELSGGQRSLVALSLILAMLLFKPAPLYILDEVDAALDLSHTQNIGIMLKEHFKSSQFIIVSLKDGMFNNANVLFRTRFVDGMSSVQRTLNRR